MPEDGLQGCKKDERFQQKIRKSSVFPKQRTSDIIDCQTGQISGLRRSGCGSEENQQAS